jgi:RND family efflux transporter MFP subunit
MMRKTVGLLGVVLAAGVLAGRDPSPGDTTAKKLEKPAGPATCKVERGALRAEVSLKGVIEAEQTTEVSVKPEAWAMPLAVKKAVPHGTAVKKGDVLIHLDLEKIDQAIKDLKADRALSDLALKQAEEEVPVLEKSVPLDIAAAERASRLAEEDLKKFTEVDRPLAEESARQAVKNAAHYLEYAKEELRQLEKMYRSKDLTEETEEIILKRQRHAVETAEFGLKTSTIHRDQTLQVDLPRKAVAAREEAVKASLALEKARHTLPLTLSQKRLALSKLRYENDKTAERLGKLEKDREAMTVRSPADGVVYYGHCQNGQWTTAAQAAAKLQPGGIVAPDEVIVTVVTPRPFFVHAVVEEKDLHWLRPGATGKAVLAGYPDLKLPAKVAQVSSVPQTAGNFLARLEVAEAGGEGDMLMPGMACTVKVTAYQKKDALKVPAGAVFTDDGEDEHYVYLAARDGKAAKRAVKVGKTAGDKTEILEGLQEGDEILTAKPEGK